MPAARTVSKRPGIEGKRDPQGRFMERIVRLGDSVEVRRFAYDSAGRLSRVTDEGGGLCESYQYDAQGRRQAEINPARFRGERRYTYGPGNRLGQAGSAQYGHDRAGFRNLKVESSVHGDAETRYHYEPSGLLLAVELPDGRRIDYAYDSSGQRTEKRVSGQLVAAYRWMDALRLSEFFDGHEWWRLAYVQGSTPVGLTNGQDSYLILADQVGTPLALATIDGHVVQAMQYDSFGNLLRQMGDIVRLPLGFAGGLFDPDTGLTRFPWRDYDADTGRFTALDPLGAKGGDADWYGYCVDDPVNRVDAWGLMGIVGELPTYLLTKAPKFLRDKFGLDPMPMERVIKEIADREITSPQDNSTGDQPSGEQWEELKKSMDEEGVPSPFEAGKLFLQDKGLWPF